ncbi:unnamed protein product [Linum tenue]|uniref:Uncharacterized protein n=1 Tax=Linum tenue TaxID=586396 RepID=A0AAV0RGG7_9ROSI|nr:unnamed protein product [Linum tenue]
MILATTAVSWLRSRCSRRSRCVLISLCSPLILPLLFISLPLLFALEICLWLRLCRRRKPRRWRWGGGGRRKSALIEKGATVAPDERLRRCEEGLRNREADAEEDGEIGRLLQVYLEDQLRLAGSIVFESDDAAESGGGGSAGGRFGKFGFREENREAVDSNIVPLLT